jgi:hypothetical protein
MGKTDADGITPLSVMLTMMRQYWDDRQYDKAVTLARLAAPYMHGRMPPPAPQRSLTNLSDEELAAWVDRLDPVEGEPEA